jgi:hypothetical protein
MDTTTNEPSALTIEEMMVKYPKDVVGQAMFRRNYKEYVNALSHNI